MAKLVRTPAAFEQVFPDVPYLAVSSFPSLDNSGDTVRLLAAARADRPGYDPAWVPEAAS